MHEAAEALLIRARRARAATLARVKAAVALDLELFEAARAPSRVAPVLGQRQAPLLLEWPRARPCVLEYAPPPSPAVWRRSARRAAGAAMTDPAPRLGPGIGAQNEGADASSIAAAPSGFARPALGQRAQLGAS